MCSPPTPSCSASALAICRWARRRRFSCFHFCPRGDFHFERGAQARPGDRMTATAVGIRSGPGFAFRASLRRNRRWALLTSYVFLILFAIFFLIPPYYMIVTSFKTDAEVAHMATNPWWVFDFTFDQY